MTGILCAALLHPPAAASLLPKAFSARFTQEYLSALSGKKRVSKGRIDYRHPGDMRLETRPPRGIVFVANARRSWYYLPPFLEGEAGEVTVNPPGAAGPYVRLFDLLAGGPGGNEYYRTSPGKGGGTVLSFTEKGARETRIKTVRVLYKGRESRRGPGDIRGLEVSMADGRSLSLALDSLDTRVRFRDSHFVFTPPPNTRVSR